MSEQHALEELASHIAAGAVTADEARAALDRYNNSHWYKTNYAGEKARYSIPANPKRDDDIRLSAFIRQAELAFADNERYRADIIALATRNCELAEALDRAGPCEIRSRIRGDVHDQLAERTAELGRAKVALAQMADELRAVRESPCPVHDYISHGREAEELRQGIEQLCHRRPPCDGSLIDCLHDLLDDVGARDSLAFGERSDFVDAAAKERDQLRVVVSRVKAVLDHWRDGLAYSDQFARGSGTLEMCIDDIAAALEPAKEPTV